MSAPPPLGDVRLYLSPGGARGFDRAVQVDVGVMRFGGLVIRPVPAPGFDEDAYLVRASIELDLEPGLAGARWAEAGFEFAAPGVAVVSAVPQKVRAEEPARAYRVDSKLQFVPAPDERTDGPMVFVEPQEPQIRTFGISTGRFRWRWTAPEDGEVGPGTRVGWFVLLAPPGTRELRVRPVARYRLSDVDTDGLQPHSEPVERVIHLPGPAPEQLRGRPAGRTGAPVQADVLIIAALPEEFDAARVAAGPDMAWREHDAGGAAPYLLGTYRGLSIALARPTRMGARAAGPLATTLADLLTPSCLAMCGVCAGNPDDTAPGDVIVASPAFAYDEGKQKGPVFQGDLQQYPLDDRWLRAVQDFAPEQLPAYGAATGHEAEVWFLERLHHGQDPLTHPARTRYFPRGTWDSRLAELGGRGLVTWQPAGWELTAAGADLIARLLAHDVDGPDRLPFAVQAGPMASGNAVMADPAVWDRLRAMGNRKILALEMEAATIATVAHTRRVPHWLVAKGVMDNADLRKDDRFKQFAARASAQVLYALLARLVPAAPARPGAAAPARPGPAGAVPGEVKLDVVRRLVDGWQGVADLVGVPGFERATFGRGDEPRALWEWLLVRDRLGDLPGALDGAGRSDLADRLRPYL